MSLNMEHIKNSCLPEDFKTIVDLKKGEEFETTQHGPLTPRGDFVPW